LKKKEAYKQNKIQHCAVIHVIRILRKRLRSIYQTNSSVRLLLAPRRGNLLSMFCCQLRGYLLIHNSNYRVMDTVLASRLEPICHPAITQKPQVPCFDRHGKKTQPGHLHEQLFRVL